MAELHFEELLDKDFKPAVCVDDIIKILENRLDFVDNEMRVLNLLNDDAKINSVHDLEISKEWYNRGMKEAYLHCKAMLKSMQMMQEAENGKQ